MQSAPARGDSRSARLPSSRRALGCDCCVRGTKGWSDCGKMSDDAELAKLLEEQAAFLKSGKPAAAKVTRGPPPRIGKEPLLPVLNPDAAPPPRPRQPPLESMPTPMPSDSDPAAGPGPIYPPVMTEIVELDRLQHADPHACSAAHRRLSSRHASLRIACRDESAPQWSFCERRRLRGRQRPRRAPRQQQQPRLGPSAVPRSARRLPAPSIAKTRRGCRA